MKTKAFTLIELLVVIVLVAIAGVLIVTAKTSCRAKNYEGVAVGVVIQMEHSGTVWHGTMRPEGTSAGSWDIDSSDDVIGQKLMDAAGKRVKVRYVPKFNGFRIIKVEELDL